jgi:F-box/leucine-rich repeat protein 2/20
MTAIACNWAYQNLQTFVNHNQDKSPSLYHLEVVEGQLVSYQTCGFMSVVELICIYVVDLFRSLLCFTCELSPERLCQQELTRTTLRESVQVLNAATLNDEEEQAFNDLAQRFNLMVGNEDTTSCIKGLYHKTWWDLGAEVQNLTLRREPTLVQQSGSLNDEEIEEGEECVTVLDLSSRKLTDDDLRALLEENPNLQKIKLSSIDVTGEAFASGNISFENLIELDLSYCKNLTDDNLRALLEKSSNLQKMKLSYMDITGEAFASENISLENVTELDLSYCKNLTDDNLRLLLEESPNLQKMKLCSLNITGEAFASENIRLENVTELDLSYCKNLTDDNLRVLLEKSPNLQTLKLDGIGITGEAFVSDNIRFENLTELDLEGCKNLTDDNLRVLLEKSPNLQTLKLNYNYGITGAVFASENIRFENFIELDLSCCRDDDLRLLLEKCRNLQTLKLNSYGITGAVFASENIKFENFIKLDLSCCRNLTDDDLRLLLEKCRNLQTVKLYSFDITGQAFASDNIRLENLIELELSCCENLTDDKLRFLLEKCHNLQTVTLYFMGITGAAFVSNNITLKSLTELNVIKCANLSVNMWALIEKCPNIQRINILHSRSITATTFTSNNIRFENLTEIHFDDCKNLSDRNLRVLLEKCPNLQRLNLNHAERITGAAFRSNNITLENLTEIHFDNCKNLSDDNLRLLLEKCPNLQRLNLDDVDKITGAAFISNNIMLENLTEIHLSFCKNLTADHLAVLIEKCPNLKRIDLRFTERITNLGIEKIANLEELIEKYPKIAFTP